jgi:hypothetical protein
MSIWFYPPLPFLFFSASGEKPKINQKQICDVGRRLWPRPTWPFPFSSPRLERRKVANVSATHRHRVEPPKAQEG